MKPIEKFIKKKLKIKLKKKLNFYLFLFEWKKVLKKFFLFFKMLIVTSTNIEAFKSEISTQVTPNKKKINFIWVKKTKNKKLVSLESKKKKFQAFSFLCLNNKMSYVLSISKAHRQN